LGRAAVVAAIRAHRAGGQSIFFELAKRAANGLITTEESTLILTFVEQLMLLTGRCLKLKITTIHFEMNSKLQNVR